MLQAILQAIEKEFARVQANYAPGEITMDTLISLEARIKQGIQSLPTGLP
jgi:hypothetical protein